MITIACLSETLLGNIQWQPGKQFKVDKCSYVSGENNIGIALLIHNALQYTQVRPYTTLEVVAIIIHW